MAELRVVQVAVLEHADERRQIVRVRKVEVEEVRRSDAHAVLVACALAGDPCAREAAFDGVHRVEMLAEPARDRAAARAKLEHLRVARGESECVEDRRTVGSQVVQAGPVVHAQTQLGREEADVAGALQRLEQVALRAVEIVGCGAGPRQHENARVLMEDQVVHRQTLGRRRHAPGNRTAAAGLKQLAPRGSPARRRGRDRR